MRLGFIGLGRMGEPMAIRLLAEHPQLVVWNRSPAAAARLRDQGAVLAATPQALVDSCECIILMLADLAAIEEVLGLGDPGDTGEAASFDGRVVVNMGTIAPADSAALATRLRERGADYVEAPVSGSRVQAENGALVAMLAGRPDLLEAVEHIVAPLCRSSFRCGDVQQALLTKLAVNTYLITMVTGLAESVHFAASNGVDLDVFRSVLDAGPMASEVSRIKVAKLVTSDHSAQASIRDVRYNAQLILDRAAAVGITLPLLADSERLLAAADGLGHGDLDMAAVLQSLRHSVTDPADDPCR